MRPESSLNKYIIGILSLILAVNLYAQTKSDPAGSIPSGIMGWKAEENDRRFDNETLYDYIDGSAEMFLSFGFTHVFNRIYSRINQPDIILDIFYMNSSFDAYGVFTHSVGKSGKEFGQQSQCAEGAIIFWKANFYVSILSHPETPKSKEAIYRLAGIIDEAIADNGDFPPVLDFLPQEDLLKESIRYFRHYNWINSHTFISNDNILNIDQNTHGLLAQYKRGDENAIFLIIMYPETGEAVNALNKFISGYNQSLTPGETKELKEGSWTGVKTVNGFLIGVFNSSSKNYAEDLIQRAETICKQ